MFNIKIYQLLSLLFIVIIFSSCGSTTKRRIVKLKPKTQTTKKIKLTDAQKQKAKELKKFFYHRYKIRGFNGAVLFAEKGKIIYEDTFGYANFVTRDTLKINTKFQLASVSKPFTSYAILLLKQRGKLSLQDSVQKYFPEFPYHGVTIDLLLIHKSGIPEYNYFADKYWENKHIPITNQDVITLMIQKNILRYYLPDKKYNYINTNYAVLASIVEKVSGKHFENFMKEEIFNPLGMSNTIIYRKGNGIKIENAATGYHNRRRKAEDHYQNGVVGDKGVYTTVEDLLKFDQELYKGTLVNKENLELAFEPAYKRLYINDNYGYGWRINAADSTNKIVYHTGWWKGFRSYFIRELGKKKTIIVLSNISNRSIFGTKELIELF